MQRADDQYTSGVETLVRDSKAIVAGPVSRFSRRVLQSHAPSGTPLRWEVSGMLEHPKILKGNPTMPVKFTRAEQSLLLDQQDPKYWESDYLNWQDGDAAVIFFADTAGRQGMRVYPSGSGNRDLAALVEHIAGIEAQRDAGQRFASWSETARSGASAAQTQTALRSLLAFRKPWDEFVPILRAVMERPEMREFAFGLTAYSIRTGQWSDPLAPAEYLCDRLENEKDAGRISSYLAGFGLLLNFANQEDHRTERRLLREQLSSCLRQRCLVADRQIAGECKDLLSRYLP